jgi:hypothetical protein
MVFEGLAEEARQVQRQKDSASVVLDEHFVASPGARPCVGTGGAPPAGPDRLVRAHRIGRVRWSARPGHGLSTWLARWSSAIRRGGHGNRCPQERHLCRKPNQHTERDGTWVTRTKCARDLSTVVFLGQRGVVTITSLTQDRAAG